MAGARAGSAPPGPRDTGALGPRRSASAGGSSAPSPRLRPLFLWVRQRDTSVVQVHCEEYDPFNRLRFTRTPLGWRVLPKTETFDAISLPRAPPPPAPRRGRLKRQSRPAQRPPRPRAIDRPPPGRPLRLSAELQSEKHPEHSEEEPCMPRDLTGNESDNKENSWSLPDIEFSIPSHTIHIPQRLDRKENFLAESNDADAKEDDFTPTPLDKLLAVAEIEFNQQQSSASPTGASLNAHFTKFPFLSEDCQRELSSFDVGSRVDDEENVEEDYFLTKKDSSPGDKLSDEDSDFQSGMVVPKDFFETITESHYIGMELVDPQGHDHEDAINANELLDSLVEKGCEDNHIIGHDFDKLAQIVNEESQANGDYDEEEEMLMDDAPVSDIIDRLGQSLCSPGQHSITAAQGLLHLQDMTDNLSEVNLQQAEQPIDSFQSKTEELVSKATESVYSPDAMSGVQEDQNDSGNHHEFDECIEGVLESQESIASPRENVIENQESPLEEEQKEDDFTTISQTHLLNNAENEIVKNIECDASSQRQPDEPQLDVREELLDKNVCEQESASSNDVEAEPFNFADSILGTEVSNSEFEKEICEEDSKEYCAAEPCAVVAPDTTKEPTSSVDDDCEIPLGKESLQCEKEFDNNEQDEDNMLPTDLSISAIDNQISDDLPKDLSCRKRSASPYHTPRRIETPRPLSRGSDTVQSPQPSGIPAVPSSPELLTPSQSKSSKSIFLESLLSSPSPKLCFSSELTITKHQNEPLNLGKSRKSASPTVSSCSEEVKKPRILVEEEDKSYKDVCDEPPLEKLNKLFSKTAELTCEAKQRKPDKALRHEGLLPVDQLQMLRCSADFELPDPLLIPKDKFSAILTSPAREIPALLRLRPELRIPEAFAVPSVLQDPDILVVSVSQLETILQKHQILTEKEKQKDSKQTKASTPNSGVESRKSRSTPVSTSSDNSSRSNAAPNVDSMASDIDAATQAALGQMLWLPYISQFEAAMACSQNADLLKALHSPVQSSLPQQAAYPDMNQMFLTQARFMNPGAFSSMPPLDYNNPLELAMWQEAMSHGANIPQRTPKNFSHTSENTFLKNLEAQNLLTQAAKLQHCQQQNRGHSARTSPIARGYRSGSSSSAGSLGSMPSPGVGVGPLPSFPWLAYPPRPHIAPLGPPQYSPGGRSRHHQQPPQSPSHYYQNNNYLGAGVGKEARERVSASKDGTSGAHHQQQRPRISVKSLENLLEPSGDVVSSTHPPEDSSASQDPQTPLWHPLFGNQKTYASPWNWTTVTVNGD